MEQELSIPQVRPAAHAHELRGACAGLILSLPASQQYAERFSGQTWATRHTASTRMAVLSSEILKSLPDAEGRPRPGVTFEELDA